MKKLLSFSVVLLLLLILSQVTAFAVDKPEYSEYPTIGIESTDPNSGEDFHTLIPSFGKDSMNSAASSTTSVGIINYGCRITKESSSLVELYALTISSATANEIGYTTYLQMWDGYDWINIGSTKNSTNFASIIEGLHPKTAASSIYYRAYTEHYIIVNGTTSMVTSTSSFIQL